MPTATPDQFVIGEGFRNRIAELSLTPLSDEEYFTPDLSICLTDKGPLWYSKKAGRVVGPFSSATAAPAAQPATTRQPAWYGSPNYTTGRPHPPVVLMVHTMGGTLAGTDSWFRNPSAQVSSHYGAGLGGELHQYVRLEDQAWVNGIREAGNRWQSVLDAAGVPQLGGLNPNTVTVGVETEDRGSGSVAVSDELSEAVRDAGRLALAKYPYSLKVVSSHHVVAPSSRANCCGQRWTVSGRLASLANDLGLALVI